MYQIFKKHFLGFFFFVGPSLVLNAQNVGVNTTGTPPAAGNMFEVLQPSTTTNSIGIYSRHSGNTGGNTYYALQAIADGTAGLGHIAAYFSATGATNNYALIIPASSGFAGIGTVSPATLFHIDGNAATTTQTAATIQANSLTSGTALDITSSGTLTGSFVKITGNSATSATLLNLSGTALTSGNGLLIQGPTSGATLIGNLLQVSSASSGAASNGFARFNFSAAHTGNGLQIDDATLTGYPLALNANSLTSGNAINVFCNGITTGNGIAVTSNSTAGSSALSSSLISAFRSGANVNSNHFAYGFYSTVTNTNATSGTNVGGYFVASGATTGNYGVKGITTSTVTGSAGVHGNGVSNSDGYLGYVLPTATYGEVSVTNPGGYFTGNDNTPLAGISTGNTSGVIGSATNAATGGRGGNFSASNPASDGVRAVNGAVAGTNFGSGLYGVTAQSNGVGTWAENSHADGYGSYGINTAASGAGIGSGVYGETSQSGGAGVWGVNFHADGDGLYGINMAATGTGTGSGLYGETAQGGGGSATAGVWGVSTKTTGTAGTGVAGYIGSLPATAFNKTAVSGTANSSISGGNGVVGKSDNATGTGVYGSSGGATGIGIWGDATGTGSCFGVYGSASGATAANKTTYGVFGISSGTSSNAGSGNIGVVGLADNNSIMCIGVDGESSTANMNGARGLFYGNQAGGTGVWASNTSTIGGANTCYGLYSNCSGTQGSAGTTHLSIYAYASGATYNAAGYFRGGGEFVLPYFAGGTTRNWNGSIFIANNFNRIYWTGNAGTNYYANSDGSADYSEFFYNYDPSLSVGEVVAVDPNHPNAVRRAHPNDIASLVGMVSLGGTRNNNNHQGTRDNDSSYINVGMLGQVPVLVTLENGNIKPGDPLTISSNFRGRAVKATRPCRIIGFALTHFPYSDGEKDFLEDVGGSAERLQGDHVMCYLNVGWYEPANQILSDGIDPELFESAIDMQKRLEKQKQEEYFLSDLFKREQMLEVDIAKKNTMINYQIDSSKKNNTITSSEKKTGSVEKRQRIFYRVERQKEKKRSENAKN